MKLQKTPLIIAPIGLAVLATSACVDAPHEQPRQQLIASVQASTVTDRNPAAFDPDHPGLPYRPGFDPADMDIHIDQPLNPLPVGGHWIFRKVSSDGEEIVEVTVLPRVATIGGTSARVIHDTAHLDGVLIEDTIDYFAQDDDDNVWYLGEDTSAFAPDGTVSHEGSWRTGVNGARPGTDMLAQRQVGDTYRQEFSPGHAEDFATIVALDASATVPAGTFHHCIQTRDQSTLDPGLDELKTFCPHVGLVLTEEGDAREELISFDGL